MNIIKLTYNDSQMLANWNTTEEWIKSLNDINEHLKNYGFLFNEFRLYAGDSTLFKVENDKDVFSIKCIDLKEHVGEKFILSFFEYYELINDEIEKGDLIKRIEESKEDIKETSLCKVLLLFDFVNYVIYKAMNQESILIEETKRRYTNSSGKRNSASKKDVVYSLTDCIRKYAKHINHCKHVFTCEHWEVRGHYRHYKSGKVVYVKPFEKGKNKDTKLKDKIYTL